jgi:hypothetical protein
MKYDRNHFVVNFLNLIMNLLKINKSENIQPNEVFCTLIYGKYLQVANATKFSDCLWNRLGQLVEDIRRVFTLFSS